MLLLPLRFEHEILGPRPGLNPILVALCAGVFVAGWMGGLSLDEAELSRGSAPWTWVTYGFVHANLFHLGGNLIVAWIFGNTLERQSGPALHALIYFLGLIVAGAAQLVATPEWSVLGASGAIYALVGHEIARHPRRRLRFVWWFVFRWGAFYAPVWLMLPIGAGFELLAWLGGDHSIATAAHGAGFCVGWLAGRAGRFMARRRPQAETGERAPIPYSCEDYEEAGEERAP